MTRIASVFIVVAALLSGACGQSDAPVADARGAVTSAAPAATPRESRPSIAASSREAARPRIVFLGDSLTAGYGLDKKDAVPSLIQNRLDDEGYRYEVVNAGVSGDTSAGGLSRLDWSLSGDVRVLVVELGANDGLRGLPVANMKRNLTEIVSRAKTRGITVLLTGMEAPPNYGPVYTAEFRQAFREVAREQKVPFIPFYLEGVAGEATLNIADGIHPNPAGARIVEQTIWRGLEPLIEKPASGRS